MGKVQQLNIETAFPSVVRAREVLEIKKVERAQMYDETITEETLNDVKDKINGVGIWTPHTPFNRLKEKELAVVDNMFRGYQKSGNIIEIPQEYQNELTKEVDLLRVNNFANKKILTPHEFRSHADRSAELLLHYAQMKLDLNPDETMIAVPWRSALVLAYVAKKLGFKHFMHINVRRDEHNLKGNTTFVEEPNMSKNIKRIKGIIVDPMLATGGTMLETIARMKDIGILERDIILMSIVTAPEGILKVLSKYPEVKILGASHDDHLNSKGYIVGGYDPMAHLISYDDIIEHLERCLGDYGDQYFEGLGMEFITELREMGMLTDMAYTQLVARIASHN